MSSILILLLNLIVLRFARCQHR